MNKKIIEDRFRAEGILAEGFCADVRQCRRDRKTGLYEVCVEFDSERGLTFKMLDKIAAIFQTSKINIGATRRGCPTCGGDNYVVLEIQDAAALEAREELRAST